MAFSKPTLIIPSETQLREFDAKLLLGCVAAERGHPVVIGSQTHIHLKITSLPRGMYFAKDLRSSKVRMLNILEKLGFKVMAWDEEGLVPHPPHRYYKTRISRLALPHISAVFAWGEAYAKLFRGYPNDKEIPVYVTGNPRIDMMRPELRSYFDDEAESIRCRFGQFVLVNTNFGIFNHYVPNLTWLKPTSTSAPPARVDEFAAGLCSHRYALFGHFRQLLPLLSKTVPNHTIVVRPHPSENHGPWQEAASGCDNIQIVHEGNVIPWLMAAQVLIHNSCTTGVEAFLVGTPSIAYQPVTSEPYDLDLANALGYRAYSFGELEDTLRSVLDRKIDEVYDAERLKKAQYHMAALEGPLASDRIVDVLEKDQSLYSEVDNPAIRQYLQGWMKAQYRAGSKRGKSLFPGNKNSADYQRHRFPGISLEEVESRIDTFRRILGRFDHLKVSQISKNIFSVVQA